MWVLPPGRERDQELAAYVDGRSDEEFDELADGLTDEDFAKAFSAYVFDTGATSDERRERTDWIAAQPGLAEFHDRAVAAGSTGLPNNFGSCGLRGLTP